MSEKDAGEDAKRAIETQTDPIILAALSDLKLCENCGTQTVMKVQTWPCSDCRDQGVEEVIDRFGGEG